MAELDQVQEQEYERLRAIKDRISDEYLRRPGIRGVGVGFKKVGGRETDRLAVRFYVAAKRTVAASEALPRELDGVPTDVIEFDPHPGRLPTASVPAGQEHHAASQGEPGAARAHNERQVDTKKYDPLLGGISIGPSRMVGKDEDTYTTGTLGLMVYDGGPDREDGFVPMMLSNAHVMCGDDGKARKGDKICQASRRDTALFWCSDCAKLERWKVDNVKVDGRMYGVDAAVAVRTHRKVAMWEIADVGMVGGSAQARVHMEVLKRGRTTGITYGRITDITCDVSEDFGVGYGIKTLFNQIVIESGNKNDFVEDGDSGSVLLDRATKKVVGLCWAGSSSSTWGVASPMAAVLQALEIYI